jgi:tripartite-type tricarboxylate transporter receptor subunit TctC
LLIVAIVAGIATGDDAYPTRPVSMVVAFPPGGVADNTARPVSAALERILKQPVAVINKPGAAGAVGNQVVATSKPDGYTLLMALVSISVLPEVDKLFGRPPNYTLAQFTGIARINADPSMLVVRADQPWKTLKDFVEDAKKRPNEIVFSSSGLYGAAHIPMEMFMLASGVKLRHLPTTGGGPMMNAILAATRRHA